MKSFVIATGNLGQDATLVELNNGGKVLNFSIAENDSYKNEKGETVKTVVWHNCKMFRKDISEKFLNTLKKGTALQVVGQLRYDSWEKNEVKITAAYIRVTELDYAGGKLHDENAE